MIDQILGKTNQRSGESNRGLSDQHRFYRGLSDHIWVCLSLTLSVFLVCALIFSAGIQSSWARSFRVLQVPHGPTFSCRTCHLNPSGGAVNSFGFDVSLRLVNGNADWPALCDLDSDQDGFSNGEELGDPECTWRVGSPAPSVSPTEPGDASSFPRPIVPDMMREDMLPPVDLGPPVDATLPVDMFIDVWDAAMYDWRTQDVFMTTDESWVAPDMSDNVDLSFDERSFDADAWSANQDRSVINETDAQIMGGDETTSVSDMSSGQLSTKSRDQSGCQHIYVPGRSSTHSFFQYGLWLLILVGWRRRRVWK